MTKLCLIFTEAYVIVSKHKKLTLLYFLFCICPALNLELVYESSTTSFWPFLSRNMTHACFTFQGSLHPLSHSFTFSFHSPPEGTGVWIILESLLRKPDPSNGRGRITCSAYLRLRGSASGTYLTVASFLSHANAPQRQNRHLS